MREPFPPDSLTEDGARAAIDCYRKAQALEPENVRARGGLRRVFGKYEQWTEAALKDRKTKTAAAHLRNLRESSPQARAVEKIDRRIAELRRLAANARRSAEQARKLTAATKKLATGADRLTAEAKKRAG